MTPLRQKSCTKPWGKSSQTTNPLLPPSPTNRPMSCPRAVTRKGFRKFCGKPSWRAAHPRRPPPPPRKVAWNGASRTAPNSPALRRVLWTLRMQRRVKVDLKYRPRSSADCRKRLNVKPRSRSRKWHRKVKSGQCRSKKRSNFSNKSHRKPVNLHHHRRAPHHAPRPARLVRQNQARRRRSVMKVTPRSRQQNVSRKASRRQEVAPPAGSYRKSRVPHPRHPRVTTTTVTTYHHHLHRFVRSFPPVKSTRKRWKFVTVLRLHRHAVSVLRRSRRPPLRRHRRCGKFSRPHNRLSCRNVSFSSRFRVRTVGTVDETVVRSETGAEPISPERSSVASNEELEEVAGVKEDLPSLEAEVETLRLEHEKTKSPERVSSPESPKEGHVKDVVGRMESMISASASSKGLRRRSSNTAKSFETTHYTMETGRVPVAAAAENIIEDEGPSRSFAESESSYSHIESDASHDFDQLAAALSQERAERGHETQEVRKWFNFFLQKSRHAPKNRYDEFF